MEGPMVNAHPLSSRLSPKAVIYVIAAAHTAWGFTAYRGHIAEIVSDLPNSVGDGIFEKAHSRDTRSSAFWFLFVGPMLALLGRLYDSAEAAGDQAAMRAAGRTITAVSAGGWIAIPRSGFPAGLALGAWLLRRAGRAAAER
jgi:hypothetical protein